MPTKTYSLRPPAVTKDGLETLFRIEMKKDDLAAEGLKAGDAIAVMAQSTGKGGVGVAYLSSDTAKSQGNVSFIKMHPKLRSYMNLELSDKCSIVRYEGQQPRVKTITVSEGGDELPIDLIDWAEIGLRQLPGIVSGATFTVAPNSGFSVTKKRILTIEFVESDDALENEKISVPFRFEQSYSSINTNATVPTNPREAPLEDNTPFVNPSVTGLPGLEKQLHELSSCIQRVNRRIEQRYEHLAGCVPILLHGPTGTGKTSVLERLLMVPGWKAAVQLTPSDVGLTASKNRSAIMNSFAEAIAAQPSLLVIDDLHTIAARQGESDVVSRDLVKQIAALKGSKVQVVAAARRPIDVDQKLLSCFMKKIELPSPTQISRNKILEHLTGSLAHESILQYVAERTHAFTATDLQELCFAAFEAAEIRVLESQNDNENDVAKGVASLNPQDQYRQPDYLIKTDFQSALRQVHPSLMDELYIEVPRVHWSDIAGSAHVKSKLWEAVELPLKHPDVVTRLNLHPSHGILLYGPPGCSKTMTAKALATESGLNFIAVKGPELVSKYVGESEYKIREIFRKARSASPSVIFFDEIDSIAPNREGGGGHEGLNTVATLLNEMDGVEEVARVLVLAATNRPEAIDPALLRPGRLGTTLYVGPPNQDAILQILKTRTAQMGTNPDGLDLEAISGKMASNGRFSGADVAALCDAAGMLCATEAVEALQRGEAVSLQQKHLDQALESAEPTLDKNALDFLQSWSVGKRT